MTSEPPSRHFSASLHKQHTEMLCQWCQKTTNGWNLPRYFYLKELFTQCGNLHNTCRTFKIQWFWTRRRDNRQMLKKQIQNESVPLLPASLMISAIQYTLVDRLVSVLTTSIRTPSSMSPQHFPIGAWSRHRVKSDSTSSLQSRLKLAVVHSHVWNSWLALQPCYCYRYTDPSRSSLQGSLSHTNRKPGKDAVCWHGQQSVSFYATNHFPYLVTYQLLILPGSVDLLDIGHRQPAWP